MSYFTAGMSSVLSNTQSRGSNTPNSEKVANPHPHHPHHHHHPHPHPGVQTVDPLAVMFTIILTLALTAVISVCFGYGVFLFRQPNKNKKSVEDEDEEEESEENEDEEEESESRDNKVERKEETKVDEIKDSGGRRKVPTTIIIDGEIGAGKSTILVSLVNYLKSKGLKVCFVAEPVPIWEKIGILKRFYLNPKLHAYEFQTLTFATRCKAMREAYEANPDVDIFVVERSPLTDRHVFMELQRDTVEPYQMAMYDIFVDEYKNIIPKELDLSKAKYVYLKPSIEVCQKRVESRAREGEIIKAESDDDDETYLVEEQKDLPESMKDLPESMKEEKKKDLVERETTSKKKEEKKPAGSGGVSIEYQKRLREAHEAFLEGKHKEKFPSMPKRPFPLENVTVINPDIADRDFRSDSKDVDTIIADIVAKLNIMSITK